MNGKARAKCSNPLNKDKNISSSKITSGKVTDKYNNGGGSNSSSSNTNNHKSVKNNNDTRSKSNEMSSSEKSVDTGRANLPYGKVVGQHTSCGTLAYIAP